MDAYSDLKAFCPGEEDGLLSVKNVRFVGRRHVQFSEEIRNMTEYESASFYGCCMTLCPWLRLGRKLKSYVWAVNSLGQSQSAWCVLRPKALWVASGNGDGLAGKPRYDVPQGVGVVVVKYRYEAELTNQGLGAGSKT